MGRDKGEERKFKLSKLGKPTKMRQVADWASIDHKVIVDLITEVSLRGGAVRFGYTRDGGAYALGIYYDGEHETVYYRPDEDVSACLVTLREDFRDAAALPTSGLPY